MFLLVYSLCVDHDRGLCKNGLTDRDVVWEGQQNHIDLMSCVLYGGTAGRYGCHLENTIEHSLFFEANQAMWAVASNTEIASC